MLSMPIQTAIFAYSGKGKTPAISISSAKQLAVSNVRAVNGSGSAINVGILRRFSTAAFKFYTKVTTTYTDVTTALNAGTATTIVTTTNSDGFIVSAKRRFSMIGITISNTATGGTYTFEYWNGSTWATLTTLEAFTNFNSTGDKYVVFLPPVEWVAGAGGLTGVDDSLYSIRILHTTAPGDTGQANAIWIAEMLDYYNGVANGNGVQLLFDDKKPFVLEGGESLIPYFSTASAANYIAAFYSQAE